MRRHLPYIINGIPAVRALRIGLVLVLYRIDLIVNDIALAAVYNLKLLCSLLLLGSLEILGIGQIMIRNGEGLNHAVIRDRDTLVPPFESSLNKVTRIDDSVHIAHVRMCVELNALDRRVIHSFNPEIGYFLNARDLADDHIPVPGILRPGISLGNTLYL